MEDPGKLEVEAGINLAIVWWVQALLDTPAVDNPTCMGSRMCTHQ